MAGWGIEDGIYELNEFFWIVVHFRGSSGKELRNGRLYI
jgi:hypothetical protein